MKQRDISIDILKFIAALAITNSHMELLYGKYSARRHRRCHRRRAFLLRFGIHALSGKNGKIRQLVQTESQPNLPYRFCLGGHERAVFQPT